MKYLRKTQDEFQLWINYGQGWEHELFEDSRTEIKVRRIEYSLNCPQYPTKVIKKRVKIETQIKG
jgi:hypothetical protein